MFARRVFNRRVWRPAVFLLIALAASCGVTRVACAQVSSVSAWEAAHFRSWSFVPYWTSHSQIDSFATDRVYDHLSDVLYFSGVKPRADGSLSTSSDDATDLAKLKNHQAQFGFRYHMSMFDVVSGQTVENVWNAITSNPTTRATFVNNVKNLLSANNMTGFNLDWERPDTVAEWANYTQLAKDMQAAFPESWEVSVDDYGFASSLWDDTPVFDARTYDQIGMMGYHYPANNGTSLDQQSFADGKKALTGQGADKAFKDSQIIIGMGTWGASGPSTIGLKEIVAANPNLPADASSFTGTVNGVTGTWDIVSRYEVRDNVQLALDRGMAGVMWWALQYEPTNKMSLARVAQHYAMFKRNIPDVNLDGKVNAADANALANNMGGVPGWTGTNTAARFETFYMNGNWEQGDHDGNGFVNQGDADWLAGRFAGLGVNLPDRLAFTGTFESFTNSRGLDGRWGVIRSGGNLPESGNYTQHAANYLAFSGTGSGASRHSDSSITLRNQNAAEAFDSLNTLDRVAQANLAQPIDLAQNEVTYFTALVRENTAPLLAAQIASPDRTLALEFRDAAGVAQFDVALFGSQDQFGIRSQADAAGDDVSTGGFADDSTQLLIGKITADGAGQNVLQVSLLPSGSAIADFTNPAFSWMLTAQSSAGFDPTITQLAWRSPYVANFTVSNVWIGAAESFYSLPAAWGDFNEDGVVDSGDYTLWRDGLGASYSEGDYAQWQSHFGQTTGAGGLDPASLAVPEPHTLSLLVFVAVPLVFRRFSLLFLPRR
ncbi:MAG: glycoside hydrolase family 18 protein [Pirellulales bacterium]